MATVTFYSTMKKRLSIEMVCVCWEGGGGGGGACRFRISYRYI